MQNGRFWQGVKRVYARYDRIMEKQGFYVVLGVCVLVIVISAVYTFRLRDDAEEPSVSAVQEEVQSADSTGDTQTLAQAQALIKSQGAAEVLSVPTEAPFSFKQPVSGFTDRTFSDSEPQFFPQSNTWQVHTGIDLQADYGTPVSACAAGTVVGVWQDNEMGLCVRINHGNGYESVYAGLSDASYVKSGDPIMQGQTLGHVGNSVLKENDALPHLHLEVLKRGRPIDPMNIFLGVDK